MRQLSALLALTALLFALPSPRARSSDDGPRIVLRRASFDPLQSTPAIAPALQSAEESTLRLLQLAAPPDAPMLQALRDAGRAPLVYIPDQAYVVRVAATELPAPPNAVRWEGAYEQSYKLPAELDALLSSGTTTHTLRLLATPDRDGSALALAVAAVGGRVHSSAASLNGTTLHVELPAVALASLLPRDDLLWVEHDSTPKLFNDRGRQIIGVDDARQQASWLSGAGQVVAVTDTGLDQQSSLSADFSGRVAQGFTPQQMSGGCATSDWSDRDGHGTHVAGTLLGSGANSPVGQSFAGVAPEARLVVQAVASASGDGSLDCLPEDSSFLRKAYDAGARVQNASWGGATGGNSFFPEYGGYDNFAQTVDSFLWQYPQHLLVAAAGNEGEDLDFDGVIDGDSISSPATAKNVLAVGASENNRPPTSTSCATSSGAGAPNFCWDAYYVAIGEPFANDFISDNPSGIAAFSSRGPADDGRIKPEIVAPGTNIVSSRSRHPQASYSLAYNASYAYESGSSMAAPMVSGAAALARQWLARERGLSTPSAALVKALLLNGAADIRPGQYGTGSTREIPDSWPNNVAGWGRLAVDTATGLDGTPLWLRDETTGLRTGETGSYTITVESGQFALRITLAWTDYPGTPMSGKALVNDLDLELVAPNGTVLHGNAGAQLSASGCRANGADRCNNVESVMLASPQAGSYRVRVRGHSVAYGPQSFAVVAQADPEVARRAPTDAPQITSSAGRDGAVALAWSAVADATSYELQTSEERGFSLLYSAQRLSGREATLLADVGSYFVRVRGCNELGCGGWSNVVQVAISQQPYRSFIQLIGSE
jgi:serine protease AprX